MPKSNGGNGGGVTLEPTRQNHPLKPQIRADVRKAMVKQMARRLDEEKIPETSVDSLIEIVRKDAPIKKLMEALYETPLIPRLSNRAAGRLVAAVDRNRRMRTERIPVRQMQKVS